MEYDLLIDDIMCFEQTGEVIIASMAGGVAPWMTSLNGGPFQMNFAYEGLEEGPFEIVIRDANGCEFTEEFELSQPAEWILELGADTTLDYGSMWTIVPSITGPKLDSFMYSWSDGDCENCSVRMIEVTDDVTYRLTVTDANGCTQEDAITLRAVIEQDIYIPNVFTPNGDLVNDHFFISTNSFIHEIEELSIFDRWGNMVFQRFHFSPNIPELGWDGKFSDQPMDPGVFAYKVRVKLPDGKEKILYGDVTLVL
jgi:gliding motility-associated-like protein